jgi:response regulator RpfG family c-di-GMP phosphodiesterase
MQVAKEMLDSNPKQRIIFASAYVEDTLRESITKLGQIVELLQKPFSLKTLNDTINDKEIYADLEKLNVDIKNLKDVEPTHVQIRDYLELMKKSQSHNN